MNILTLNSGSNSLKFEVVRSSAGSPTTTFGSSLIAGSFDDIGKDSCSFALLDAKRVRSKASSDVRDPGEATRWLLDWFDEGHARENDVGSLSALDHIAHRVVHGGAELVRPAPVTDGLVGKIKAIGELAPLHTDAVLAVIDAARAKLGSRIPMTAVFDTAFHHDLPDEAALYGLPQELARRHQIRRYGFHGISHRYLTLRHAEITNSDAAQSRLVTLHLEGGSSAAAIRGGRSIETSMGLTPLEGLLMGTRSGDLDPGVVFHLMRKEGWTVDETERFLNKRCGLLGVSRCSADTRELEKHLADPAVDLALSLFCHRVRKYIGAYLAVLGGADAIVFGGGIGENAPLVRERICRDLAWCGATFDPARNRDVIDREGLISTDDSAVALWVIPTQEGLMMARYVIESQQSPP